MDQQTENTITSFFIMIVLVVFICSFPCYHLNEKRIINDRLNEGFVQETITVNNVEVLVWAKDGD